MSLAGLRLSSILLFSALVCFSWVLFLLWLRHTPLSLSFSTLSGIESWSAAPQAKDFSLSISALNISLPVSSRKVEGSHWPLSSTGLVHVAGSPLPGEAGNSIIYGHNWPNLLGRLAKAEVGQIVNVETNGQTSRFVIEKVSMVSPHDTVLLQPTTVPTLTLYTCGGFLDTLRVVVTATLL